MSLRRSAQSEPYWIYESEPGREIPRSVLAKWEFYRITSRKNCRRTHYCDMATLVLAALAPAMTVIVNRPVVGALIGVAVVITSGSRGIYRWDQNWISRARACYAIEHEVALYVERAHGRFKIDLGGFGRDVIRVDQGGCVVGSDMAKLR